LEITVPLVIEVLVVAREWLVLEAIAGAANAAAKSSVVALNMDVFFVNAFMSPPTESVIAQLSGYVITF
jgi:hypothetical protein